MDEMLGAKTEGIPPAPIEVRFSLNQDEVYDAVKTVQLRRGRVVKAVQTAALTIIVAMYAQAVWVDPSYATGYVMGALCLALVAAVWLTPLYQAHATATRAAGQTLSYEMEFYPESYMVKEADGAVSKANYYGTEAWETDRFVLLISRRTQMYCVPKRALPKEELKTLAALLQNGCGEGYKTVSGMRAVR